MEKENFTISAYTENNIGLLNRISAIFLKRHINLDSMTASQSEIKDVLNELEHSQVSRQCRMEGNSEMLS